MSAEQRLLADFEAARIDPGAFGHRDHLRVAWALLGPAKVPFGEAYARFREGLIGICAKAGAPEKYSETLTLGWLALVHEAIQAFPETRTWESFETAAGAMLGKDALSRRYPQGQLKSDAARAGLVLPR